MIINKIINQTKKFSYLGRNNKKIYNKKEFKSNKIINWMKDSTPHKKFIKA